MQVYADVLADLELAVWLLWFAGHGEILWLGRRDVVVKSEPQQDEGLRKLFR
jgi:hypothetical protein